jgi:hypothetical protein
MYAIYCKNFIEDDGLEFFEELFEKIRRTYKHKR